MQPLVLLESRQLAKSFDGVQALQGVDFTLRPGEVHAVCGENGAGKSTLIKILSGIHPHGTYQGELLLAGAALALRGVADAQATGIAVIHQELALCPELSVAENIFLGVEPCRHGLVDALAMIEGSREALRDFAPEIDPQMRLGTLGIGAQQLVEIVRALRRKPRILILDEPTAALSHLEVTALLATLRTLSRQGVSCLFVSHRLEEVFSISNRITVLRDGRSMGTADTATTTREEVIRLMVGRDLGELYPRTAPAPGAVVLAVAGLCAHSHSGDGVRLSGLSFTLRAGEVLGIGGLMGAGRSELLLHLFGAWGVRTAGSVELLGRGCQGMTASEAIRRGMVLVSEDRKRLGLVIERSVGFNLSLSTLRRFTRWGLLDAGAEFRNNREVFERLRIHARDLDSAVSSLSGGNQQKVVLGKALMTSPRVVLLDEPTRGIDVGAKSEVYAMINELTAAGLGVVLVSSELPELMGMSDRILMLGEGCHGGEFTRAQASPQVLLEAALAAGERARASRGSCRAVGGRAAPSRQATPP